MTNWTQIFVACVGFGAGGEAVRQYRAAKVRRRSMTALERNAGFWTDRRFLAAEIAVFGAVALFVIAMLDTTLVMMGILPLSALPF